MSKEQQYKINNLEDVTLDLDRPFIGLANISNDVLEQMMQISFTEKQNNALDFVARMKHQATFTAIASELHSRISPACKSGCYCKP